ncbi:MAG: glycoside hydrolase family 65 [Bacilli bacterium]|nr:glycoside hydrolase family 65 [Bacilli bacterium]
MNLRFLILKRLEIFVQFSSPNMVSNDWANSILLNLEDNDNHETILNRKSLSSVEFIRKMDDDGYRMSVEWRAGKIIQDDNHIYRIIPSATDASFECSVGFSILGKELSLDKFDVIKTVSKKHWESFWTEGGAVEFSSSQDPRAHELERRVVLSQFLTAIHCSGSLPPQETGLLYNSWYGKFHLEMHWWHAAHFALWGRTHLLKKSMDWYLTILPIAKELAYAQGYDGARWPKMIGPNGIQSPSTIGNLLIWQQPHPIALVELCYKAEPTYETLNKYKDLVMETADFMASFAVWDEQNNRYVLGPPVIPAQESHQGSETWNPTFELEYWRFGLTIAMEWRNRLGLEPISKWQHVSAHLSKLPQFEGVYLAHENCPTTFTQKNNDHPSMLAALGILSGTMADREVMRKTLQRVALEWQWETAWGWDFPMAAMTAARLGEGHMAIDFLLMKETKNTYLANGHNYQRADLMAYLPGNGGLLAAVALMACGWEKCSDQQSPGFPSDGTWSVQWEGLNAWL